MRPFSLASLVAVAALIATSGSAGAATKLGQTAPAPATFTCGGPSAFLQKTVASGTPSYRVPAGGGVITSWSTQAVASDGKDAELKLFTATSTPGSYVVVGQDGPHMLTSGTLNTFPVRIPVRGGEILGLYYSVADTACEFEGVAGDATTFKQGTNPSPPLGSTYTTDFTDANFRVNVSALLEPDCDKDGLGDETQDTNLSTCAPGGGGGGGGAQPSNDFSFGKVKKNKRKGTAKLTVKVPGAGELDLAKTKKVKPDEETAEAAGKEKLSIRPKGKAKKKLNNRGKAKVKAKVTFAPTGGSPNTESKKIKLVKR
jgi:hypothetical protein